MENKALTKNIQQVTDTLTDLTKVLYDEAKLTTDEKCSSTDEKLPEGDASLDYENNNFDIMNFTGNEKFLDAVSCRYEDVAAYMDVIVYALEARLDALQRGAMEDMDSNELRSLLVAVCQQHFCMARCYQDTLDELLHALFVGKASLCGAALSSSMQQIQELMERIEDFLGDNKLSRE